MHFQSFIPFSVYKLISREIPNSYRRESLWAVDLGSNGPSPRDNARARPRDPMNADR